MVIKEEGHAYELQNFESTGSQELRFIKKEPISEGSTELKTVMDGTTNEEVLLVLINRLQILNKKFPCRENSVVITKLEEAWLWLNYRTSERKIRGVEGKQIA